MPPKRKNENDSQDENKKKSSKKEPVKPLDETQPVNKQIPDELNFDKPSDNNIRLATWNIASYNASIKKGFHRYVQSDPLDLIVLTETKLDKEPNDELLKSKFSKSVWVGGSKKGQAGIAILWNGNDAHNVTDVLPTHPQPDSTKGRIITLEFDGVFIVGTYVPNAGQNLKAIDDKNIWNDAFYTYIHQLDSKKPIVWIGDINVCHDSKDLRNDKSNWNKSPGWSEPEVNAFKKQLNPNEGDKKPLIDVWKAQHLEDEGQYTYWGYRFDARTKGIGWRLDSAIVSERLMSNVNYSSIRREVYGASDHVPMVIDIDIKLQ